MALLTAPVAGAYTATFNALSLGMMTDDGFTIMGKLEGEEINSTDQYGKLLIEGIYQGYNWRARFRSKEWNTGVFAAFLPTGAGSVAPAPVVGVIGRKYTALAKAMVLTATAATPAAAAPATLTATLALLSRNTNVEIGFTSKIREVPIEVDLLPDLISAAVVPFVCT